MFPGLGVDPQRIAEMQTVSKFIFAKIRVDYAVNTASVELSSAVPAAAALIPELLEQFAPSLGFTEHDRETTVQVMAKSKIVQDWARGLARAFDVDLNTPAGRKFFEEKCREQAERLVK